MERIFTYDNQGNQIDNNNQASGGAVYVGWSSQSSNEFVLFDGCIFKNNVAKSNQTVRGGALNLYYSQAKILNSLFYNNTAYSSVDGPINLW